MDAPAHRQAVSGERRSGAIGGSPCRLAMQLALLEYDDLLTALVSGADFTDP
ncbi:hypothetical protein ACFYOK_31615 [Microbispora bryophytorum]|uniref:hypothetical protein n=1 Tax=Microbispora bryophytorum TaxID=1460882 RepID=UPI0033E88EB0